MTLQPPTLTAFEESGLEVLFVSKCQRGSSLPFSKQPHSIGLAVWHPFLSAVPFSG